MLKNRYFEGKSETILNAERISAFAK